MNLEAFKYAMHLSPRAAITYFWLTLVERAFCVIPSCGLHNSLSPIRLLFPSEGTVHTQVILLEARAVFGKFYE